MPEIPFNIDGRSGNKIRIEFTNIKADGGPEYPRLIVAAVVDVRPIKGNNNEEIHFSILNAQCGLFLHEHPSKAADAIASFNPRKISHENNLSINFEFPFDSCRLKRIEEKRRNDAKVRLKFVFLVGLYQQNSLFDFTNFDVEIELEVPKSHWVEKILPKLGLGEYFIVEIPHGQKVMQEAWAYLEKAERSFWEWNSKSAYVHCRELGILLDRSIKDKLGLKAFSVSERWIRAYEKFNHYASLDLHLEYNKKSPKYSKDEIKISKADVEHLLITSKALIKYAEELLQE